MNGSENVSTINRYQGQGGLSCTLEEEEEEEEQQQQTYCKNVC
jgi:hypothetical protein